MSGQDILNLIAVKAYEKPISKIRDLPNWPSLSNALHVAILLIDFDTEVNMNGLLGFLENPTGAYLNQTIEAFRTVGARNTADILGGVCEVMNRHGVSHQRLREPLRQVARHQVTSFSKLHGPEFAGFAKEVSAIQRAFYVHNRSQESPFPLLEAYLEKHAAEIQAEMERLDV